MIRPEWGVATERDGVTVEFVVPGSKFGAIEVVLTPDGARELADALIDVAESADHLAGAAETSTGLRL